jgi:hypothetical protein
MYGVAWKRKISRKDASQIQKGQRPEYNTKPQSLRLSFFIFSNCSDSPPQLPSRRIPLRRQFAEW